MKPQQYAKAIIGAVIAGLTALAGYLIPGSTAAIAVTVALAFLGALGVIFATPNSPKGQGGHTENHLIIAVATLIIVVLIALRVFGVL
jgi:hypothetical protein